MRLFLAAAVLLAPAAASAHAILVQSSPPNGAHLKPGEHTLVLRYNSRIDQERSRLTLTGSNAQAALPLEVAPSPDALSAKAELTPGSYVLHWQVLAIDGHLTRGDVRFTVDAP